MAAKTLTIETLNDDDRFAVDLKRPIQIGRTWLRPGQRIEMKGSAVKEHAQHVDAVRPIAD